MRRLLHQGTKHGTVYHDDASNGVFLLLLGCRGRASTSSSTCGCLHGLEQPFSRMISLLSFLYSLWTASRVNGSLPANGGVPTYLGLHHLRTEEIGGGGLNRLRNRPGRPAQVLPSPIRSPFCSHGSSCHFALSPFNYVIWVMSSSRPR
jgi:hypothetical protein